MRIPVYPADLISNRGFKSLAKQLRKLLQGPSRVPLAFAQNLLAKGLGYQDYYDLEQSAKSGSPAMLTATERTAELAILTGIQAALKAVEVTANERELRHFVRSSALSSLMALKRNRVPYLPRAAGPTSEDLQALERLVNASESLRDQALFACMQAGVRPVEYLNAIYHNRCGAYRLYKARHVAGQTTDYAALPETCQGPITKYARAEKRSEGDWLFPSARDPEHPMSTPELARLLSKWSREADIQGGSITASGIRQTTDAYKQSWMRRFGDQTRHHSVNSTQVYLAEQQVILH